MWVVRRGFLFMQCGSPFLAHLPSPSCASPCFASNIDISNVSTKTYIPFTHIVLPPCFSHTPSPPPFSTPGPSA